ncbi:unnamed protein product [Closterium sp. NIES-53]
MIASHNIHLPSFSTNLVSTAALLDTMVTTTTHGGQRVSICTCTPTLQSQLELQPDSPLPAPSPYAEQTDSLIERHEPKSHPALPVRAVRTGRRVPRPRPRPVPDTHIMALRPSSIPLRVPLPSPPASSLADGPDAESDLVRAASPTLTRVLATAVTDPLFESIAASPLVAELVEFAAACRLDYAASLVAESESGTLSHGGRSYLHDPCGCSPFSVVVCGPVGDASVFRVWGSCAFVRDTSANKLSARAIPCVFLIFFSDAPGWQFYHPTLHRVLPSQDLTFDESVPFYRLFPYRSAPLPPPPLFLAPGPPPVDPLLPQGPAPSGVSQVDPLPGTVPVEVAVDLGAARGATSGGAEPKRAKPGGAELGGAELERAEPGGAEPECTEPRGTLSTGGPQGALSRWEPLSPRQVREWFARRTCLRNGAAGARGAAGVEARGTRAGAAGGTGASGPGGARTGGARTGGTGAAGGGGVAGVRAVGTGARAAGPGGARPGGIGAAGAGGAAGIGAGDPGAGDTGAGGAGPGGSGAVGAGSGDSGWPRPYFVPLLQQVLGLPSSTGLTPPLLCPQPDQLHSPLQPTSPLPAPSPYTEQTGGLTKRRDLVSCPVLPVRAVRTGCRVPCPRPPPVPGTHQMSLRPSSVPLRVPLPSPPASSLADGLGTESDLVRAASPTVPCLLATVATDPSFESAAASALVAELVDCCRLSS